MNSLSRYRTPLLLALAVLLVAACGGRRVTRMESREVVDLSGRWNDTDSRQVAETMIQDAMTFPWIENFRQSDGDKPIVIAYGVKNRTDEHINTRTFMKDLERAFLRSGRVSVVADTDQREAIRGERAQQQQGFTEEPAAIGKELGANFVLTGELNSIRDRLEGQEVIFYQANLELINVETNEKVWIGEHEIKKFIDRSAYEF